MESHSISRQSMLRPYRSHKVPACISCRRRKIRCDFDTFRECRPCRERQVPCEFVKTKHQGKCQRLSRTHSERSDVLETAHMNSPDAFRGYSNNLEQFTFPGESNTLIANPTMAEDLDILETYITSQPTRSRPSTAKLYERVSREPNESIMYIPAPRRRPRLAPRKALPGIEQRDIMDQVLGPLRDEVIELYFAHLHPCLPIVDQDTFLDMWHRDRNRISPTLACDIYAVTIPYWAGAESLQSRTCPDTVFTWNLAVAALEEDFTAPSITTLASVLLDLSGRPALEMRHNILNVGRACQLSQSLGLHRNPTDWQISTPEKNLRMNLWWTVLIHVYWSSLTHGTPPIVCEDNFDVPLPSQEQSGNTDIFVCLCSLTKVLGTILPLVYTLRPNRSEMQKAIRRIECALDDLEETFPALLHSEDGPSAGINGKSNLALCFLTLRLVLSRITFRAIETDQADAKDIKKYRRAMLKASACKITRFMTSLGTTKFREFWLPYASHIMVLVTTVLLRCIAEFRDDQDKRDCAQTLAAFMDRLTLARSESDWELADTCLERYRPVVQAIMDNLARTTGQSNAYPGNDPDISRCLNDNIATTETGDMNLTFIPEGVPQMDLFDEPWESLWLDEMFPLAD